MFYFLKIQICVGAEIRPPDRDSRPPALALLSHTRAVQSNFRGTAFPESISNRWQVAGSLQFDARAQFDDPIGRETEELGSVGSIVFHPGKKPAEQGIQSASPRTKGTTDEAVKARCEFS